MLAACVIYPTRRRRGVEPADSPKTRTLPPAMIWTPTKARISVVFPLPLGPSNPTIAPCGTSRSSPSMTVARPRRTRRPRVTIALFTI